MTTPATGIDLPTEHSRACRDAWILLEFLGQQADSRLQAHFEDTRAELAAPIHKLAAPPCRTYRHFLNRLITISGRLSCSHPVVTVPEPAADLPSEGDEGLGDLDFLYFSRDFLAAAAAPATVDTIALTRAYVNARRVSPLARMIRVISHWVGSKATGSNRVTRATSQQNDYTDSAGRIARRVVLLEYGTVVLTLITLAVSAYALSGRLILDSERQVASDYAGIQRDLELAASGSGVTAVEGGDSLIASCGRPGSSGDTAVVRTAKAEVLADASSSTQLASASAAPVQTTKRAALCWRVTKAREDVVVARLHLVSWTGVVIEGLKIGELFGINRGFIEGSATLHPEWCGRIGANPGPDGACSGALSDALYRSDEVAQSLLGCIALYVLPALYGCLGAAAATFRMLRRKVDQSLVSVTDRGRVMQDIVLGLLCGAIMGLFVGYIGKGTPDLGLGLSALALLAGYNVSGVFAFLDELCNRVFQPGQAAH